MTSDPQFDPIVAAAAAEERVVPTTEAEVADRADAYDAMMRLASLFDDSGEELRQRAKLGTDIVDDPAFSDSVVLSRATGAEAEEAIRAATSSKGGLLSRSVELDADALVLRATVLTYRWIDELQEAALQTIGSIAARAIGYLAPEVALGGAIVSAGLIETDVLDRDGVAAYLGELAEANPELLDHVTSGGGGLLDGLQMRSLLTVGFLAGERGGEATRGGLRAIGAADLPTGFASALRDMAGGLVEETREPDPASSGDDTAPSSLAELMERCRRSTAAVDIRRVEDDRFVVFCSGASPAQSHLRLVGGDNGTTAQQVLATIRRAVRDVPLARLMLVGMGQGGVIAAEVAAAAGDRLQIDQVVTAGSPSAHVPRIAEPTRVLSLEDRSDPVALFGSLVNAGVPNRVTVVFEGPDVVAGARAADETESPDLRAELSRLRRLGFLAG